MKTNNLIKTLLLFTLVINFTSCGSFPPNLDINDAIKSYGADVKVKGIDVDSVSLSITLSNPTSVDVPAGTHLESNSAGTQNMITAAAVHIVVDRATVNTEVYQKIEVYCTNRFLEAPTSASSFTVSGSSTNEPDSLQLLASCLDGKDADHYTRQLAMWMQSDNLMNMTKKQVRSELRKYYKSTIQTQIENNSHELAEKFRNDMPAYRNYSDDVILQAIERLNPILAKEDANDEINLYLRKASPLLKECGIDISAKLFFQ